MIQIAVLGYGTIGSGVAEVLKVNKESITKRVGDEISIKYILDLREFPGDPMEDKIVHDYAVIKNDPEIAIVVEAMGSRHTHLRNRRWRVVNILLLLTRH